jgi:hypothetical protein
LVLRKQLSAVSETILSSRPERSEVEGPCVLDKTFGSHAVC